ncbi:MAG: ABC transporter permease, partial [Thermoanaerobaculia bacterium]
MRMFSRFATNDLALALRSLRRTPGFTFIAIVTLALGIGANTSMFSLLNGYFLTPAPYPDSDRLDRLYRATPRDARGGFSPADWLDLRTQHAAYGDIAAYAGAEMSISDPRRPAEVAEGLRVSANLFSVLGTAPSIGRGFRSNEEIHGNHRVLVLSHRYWQNRFGGDPAVIGSAVRVDGETHEIVGILPPGFSDWRHLSWVDVYRPLGLSEKETTDRGSAWLRLVGRRAPDVSLAQAEALVAELGRRLATEHPIENAETTWRVVPIDETWVAAETRPVFLMLVGLSGFVLLIACSNLANLLLARTLARAREFAVRSALGASRARLVRPLAIESFLLALGGGACALIVAVWTFDWMRVASAGDSGVGVELRIDWRILTWAFL